MQKGGYNHEIEWFLNEVSGILGERSNFGGLVSAIERGGSGGCSGTKGCGRASVDPFERYGALQDSGGRSVHGDMERVRECTATWRLLGDYSRDLLAARYCCSVDKLTPGLHGQLGDLAAVSLVVAAKLDDEIAASGKPKPHKSIVEQVIDGATQKGALRWIEKLAGIALEMAHGDWEMCRALV